MKPLTTFHVIPDLPDPLAPLWDLSHNLWWSWSTEVLEIFHDIDSEVWFECDRSPLRFLASLGPERIASVQVDAELIERIERAVGQFEEYRSRTTWFEQTHGPVDMQIAYFSLEFGIAKSLPVYSGGLGVLAGDHLKSASNLGLPLVGVGLLYRQEQALNPDGWQLELYPESNFDQLPIQPVPDESGEQLTVEVAYPSGCVRAQVWRADIGRVELYLLDTNVQSNTADDRNITALLYGGDREMRIKQEILLGIGGYRALTALGIAPSICHMNEGHSAFQALERIRVMMTEHGFGFEAAREATTAGNVFTTHTPVAAGNDWFSPDLVERYFHDYRQQLGLSREDLLGLGRINPDDNDSEFCMTVLAMRLSAHSNGVSRLHGEVSREMWARLWPELATAEIPITHVTNGVHSQSWASAEISELLDNCVGESWRYTPIDGEHMRAIYDVSNWDLWQIRQFLRARLVEFARRHLRVQFTRQGQPPARIEQSLQSLDEGALTIGFARRFATYKRGSLILRSVERLAELMQREHQPLQILFAGKAHPHDHEGKELIREIVALTRQEPFTGRVFFLENYDINVARYLVQGCDIWLNNPRRPQEASGTSGMKAALNGALNISVLDGWWVEACELHSGWSIGRGEVYEDLSYQDQVESSALYDLLETEVIPMFYTRAEDGVPHEWVSRIKSSVATLVPQFNTNRMVREYLEELYLPNQSRWEALNGDRERIAKLSEWKRSVRSAWSGVRIESVDAEAPTQPKVGMRIPLRVSVQLGQLSPDDVRVELYTGRVNARHEIVEGEAAALGFARSDGDGRYKFGGNYICLSPGSHGYTVRVVPNHPDLAARG